MTDPQNCDHDDLTYRRTDTAAEPDAVYTEWHCRTCGSTVSLSYTFTGTMIVQTPDGEVLEEELRDW